MHPSMEDHEEEVEGMDAIEFIGTMLQTEDGETIPDFLKMICQHFENQNKILIKILSALKEKPASA